MSVPVTLVLNRDGTVIRMVPLLALPWQKAIRAVFVGSVIPISYYEDWIVHSPSMDIPVPSVVMTKRWRKRTNNVVWRRSQLLLRDNHECQYCGFEFPASKLTLDHVTPRSHGGALTYENIVAACGPCNQTRGNDASIRPKREPFTPKQSDFLASLRRRPITIPHASWIPYLGWDESLVTICPPSRSLIGYDDD